MRRILVIGSPGAGKSRFSRRLSRSTGIELIHLDRIFWKPGWVESDKREFDERLGELLKRDSWIIDGNYSRTLAMRLERADAVVMLDMNRWICTWRVLKRGIFYRKGKRTDMADGCDEHLDISFLKWTWKYPDRSRPGVIEKLRRNSSEKKVFWLRSVRDVSSFFEQLGHLKNLEKIEVGSWKQ